MADKKNGSEGAGGAQQGQSPPAKISKQEGVRRALAKLGKDAKPTAIQSFVKNEFGIEMSTDHISTAKGEIRRQAAAKAKKAAKKPAPPKPAPSKGGASPAPVARPPLAGNGRGGIQLEDILAAKALVERVGAEQLRALIDALAR
jgi:hypothetical protein